MVASDRKATDSASSNQLEKTGSLLEQVNERFRQPGSTRSNDANRMRSAILSPLLPWREAPFPGRAPGA